MNGRHARERQGQSRKESRCLAATGSSHASSVDRADTRGEIGLGRSRSSVSRSRPQQWRPVAFSCGTPSVRNHVACHDLVRREATPCAWLDHPYAAGNEAAEHPEPVRADVASHRQVRREVICLCEGGPIESMERVPWPTSRQRTVTADFHYVPRSRFTTSRVVKGYFCPSFHYVPRSQTAHFRQFFTTGDVHLLDLAIGRSPISACLPRSDTQGPARSVPSKVPSREVHA